MIDDEPTPIWCDHVWPTGATCTGHARWSVAHVNGEAKHEERAATHRKADGRRLTCDGHLFEALVVMARTGMVSVVRYIAPTPP